MKNKTFFQSVYCAVKGLASGFKSEKNFKIYTIIALSFLLFNILLGAGMYDILILVSLTCGVFAAEYINTAIERICDRFCPDSDEDMRFVKDVAAGAVLCMGIAFFSCEFAILIPKLVDMIC